MPKVSVIIPVYNSEKYLDKCLESVINQTLSDIEILCVNNGSTDKCPQILKNYEKKDKRFKIITFEKNLGSSIARNKGIDEANGEFIAFIDSDDFIDADYLEKLFKIAIKTNSDCAKGNIYNYDVKTKQTQLTDFYNMNNKIRRNKSFFYYGFTSAIYKKSFLDKFNIRFPENISYFEDPYFSIKAAANYKKICFDDTAKYYYSQYNQNSVTSHATMKNFMDFHDVSVSCVEYLNKQKISKHAYNTIFNFLYNFAKRNYYNTAIDKEVRDYIFDTIMDILLRAKYEQNIPKNLMTKMHAQIRENKYYETLLDNYKKFDYLNKNNTFIKIFVSYIRPSFLFKSEILTPIHLGRYVEKEVSKDGKVNDKDIKWLHENCMGDDDFEGNISHLNRRIGFFTGTYWAWKNYNKLGNPKYFGSMGYRKIMFPNCLTDIEKYDFVCPKLAKFKKTLKEQFIENHGNNYYNMMFDTIKNTFPDELDGLTNYFKRTSGYFLEMYIMKKDLFFEYCEWINKIINYMLKAYPNFVKPEIRAARVDVLLSEFTGEDIFLKKGIMKKEEDLRDIAFIVERLTGYYIYKLTNNKMLKHKEVTVFEPELSLIPPVEYKKIILEQMRKNIRAAMNRGNL